MIVIIQLYQLGSRKPLCAAGCSVIQMYETNSWMSDENHVKKAAELCDWLNFLRKENVPQQRKLNY